MEVTVLTRREFIKWLTAVGATSTILKLTGCTPAQSVTPIPSRTKPTAIPPTKTKIAPTAASTVEATQPPAATATATPLPPYLSVAHGDDPATITQRAINALGGMERFVQPGQNVLIKPNICVAYHPPEYAATTNPQVVAALVTMCLAAGAANVSVM
ncbi:MAG TPA: DUF362 domain-containing protein, partial [Saprospiraceae bacterium]|nr:DUF362 domain-containing protein [Saprospiraceae bacterium]